MKKIFLLGIILMMFGCQNNQDKVVNTDPEGYSPLHLAKPDNYGELFSLINTDIQKIVMEYKDENKIPDDEILGEFHGRALVDENGNIARIYLLNGVNKDIDELIIKTVENFDYQPGKIEGKAVPYKFDFKYKNVDYFMVAEEMPEPVGGIAAIGQKVRYPEIAKRAGIEGRVFVKAIIDTQGNVIETEVIKGLGAGTDEAAVEAIKNSKFIPGKINGKPVKVQVAIPILFKLQ